MRIRLDIAYDGTHFRGWALQPGLRTVQGTLEGALARILGGQPRLVVAGRTDAGVHATGQVAHVDLDEEQVAVGCAVGAARHPTPCSVLAARVRGVVGAYSDVAVHRTLARARGFRRAVLGGLAAVLVPHRRCATGYDPLERHRTTTVRAELDEQAMDAAARSLIGLHDFAAYCKPREEATTIRTLLEFDWRRDAEGVLVANVKADAFCHSMVRALVGACVAVGQGRLTPAHLAVIRDEAERTNDFTVLAARGLTLTEVGYPDDELLGARAEQTRARRDRE